MHAAANTVLYLPLFPPMYSVLAWLNCAGGVSLAICDFSLLKCLCAAQLHYVCVSMSVQFGAPGKLALLGISAISHNAAFDRGQCIA